jgi:hypothetical protein
MRNWALIVIMFYGVFNTSDAQRRQNTNDLILDSLTDGMKVTIRGTAEHAKPDCDPMVLTKEGPVYIAELMRWDKKVLHKKIQVTGVVMIVIPQVYGKDGIINQCAPGRNVFLKNAVWKVIR